MKGLLRTARAQANDLLAAVKCQKKQAQMVQSTLSALRELRAIEA